MSEHQALLQKLRGGLIVSVQARTGSPLDDPEVLGALAAAAAEGGAIAIRAAGARNIEAIRKRTKLPIVGIVKREYPGFEPYITPTGREVREILDVGAEIVAFDATQRARPEDASIAKLIAAIDGGGAIPMADCATPQDGKAAADAGALILATTLCGYTHDTVGAGLPALGLVRELRKMGRFVICEGGIHSPAQGAAALAAGADAIVVGTAITNVEWRTAEFAAALRPQTSSPA